MRPLALLLPAVLLTAVCVSEAAPLPKKVSRLAGNSKRTGSGVAVAFYHSGTGASFFVEADLPMHPASTMKVPVMMALFEAVDRGELRLDEPVAVRNEFRSIVDGSPFQLDPKADGDPDLYAAVGQARPLEELVRRMIVRSSNLATNLLIERLGASRVTDLMRQIGARDLRVLRGVEDEKAFNAGLNNSTTARDLMTVLKTLLPGAADVPWSPRSTAKMLDILRAQEFNEKIPAGLPPGVPVAHKTGDITAAHHDAAIVFPPGEAPYVLVVLVEGVTDEKAANRKIAEISRAVWEGRQETPGAQRGREPRISPSGPSGG